MGGAPARWVLERAPMHALSYLQKRGHLSMVATGRRMFRRVGAMTPARFDILYVIYEYVRVRGERETGSIWQALVHRSLGLTRQTVWKAIVRLVELGYLEKKVDPDHKQRRILVKPTEEGVRWIRRAYGVAFTERYEIPPTLTGEDPPRHAHRMLLRDAHRAARATHPTSLPFSWHGDAAPPPPPTKAGREVAKTFHSRTWESTQRGHGRWRRYMNRLDSAIDEARELARAFGDRSQQLLYEPTFDPEYIPRSRDTFFERHADVDVETPPQSNAC